MYGPHRQSIPDRNMSIYPNELFQDRGGARNLGAPLPEETHAGTQVRSLLRASAFRGPFHEATSCREHSL